MSWEEFRRIGHEVIDWIAEYHNTVGNLPVLSKVKPGQIREQLPQKPIPH